MILDTIKGNIQEIRRLRSHAANIAGEADQVQRHTDALVASLDEKEKADLAAWRADFEKRQKG